MKGYLILSLLPLLVSTSPLVAIDTIHNGAAPLLSSSESKEIPNSYIIVFKKEVSATSAFAHHSWVQEQHAEIENKKRELQKRDQKPLAIFGGLKHTFDIAGALFGYSGHFDEDVIERIRRHPDVSMPAFDNRAYGMCYPMSVLIGSYHLETDVLTNIFCK